ncbi:aarF domain-containing protein kinase 1 isoform X1 [Mustela nigripes]|uniref:AarF domain-containing protein kinase 1 n=2 Tax=Mustela putorius furo TaxID=9669 RepID=M3YBD7_MUSPF|nr:aarF domain-containing protein kinase 1 isoform X1 [Mustela putorius furo]XP_059038664.1 aarF domain-containing protein kinase 1 isoform X1 [Mustela lutreola]XP_059038665.1 aarF domain-containing protein kinase 1 isoform X1 [Mustela lutreola]XP_059229613.1 aarF domain-containing protein kinase 1 isoform X1 [Mustela nigripes]XP_059229614.1 aarF domain-containing protein kinase 1 isoform X1 [Mustela nigripes]
MARKALKLASWTGAALAASGFYLYSNKYLDPNDFGAVRVGRAVATTAVISYDYLTSLRSVPYGSEEYLQLRSKVHLRSARRLCELCCANRGTFIKVGQHLGALDYLLPEEYTSTLKVLHSQAPQSSMHEVRQVIREDLGKEIHDLFVSFDDTPLGAASLAQVHKAVLRDGRTVAVKVQHPKVQSQSSKDILLMEVLVLAVKQLFPEFEFMWLVDEAKKNLPLELDFLNEGRNAEKVAQMLKDFDFLKVPRIYWELSTKRVLLMEFVDGGQVNDRDYMERNKIDVNEISRHLGKMYSEMIFVNGFVHCDPHPGNVLVRKCPGTGKAEVVLLDHGLYQVLTDEFRLDYCRLWQSLIWTDMEKVKKYSQRLGAGGLYPLFACMLTARSWDSVNRGIGQAPVTATEDAEIRNNAANYLPQISQLLNHVPRQMLLLFKTNDLLRGIEAALGTRASASSFLNMSRCCVRALAAHKKKNSRSLFRRTQISFREAFNLWQINLHELILRVKGLRLASWVLALLCRLLPTSY